MSVVVLLHVAGLILQGLDSLLELGHLLLRELVHLPHLPKSSGMECRADPAFQQKALVHGGACQCGLVSYSH